MGKNVKKDKLDIIKKPIIVAEISGNHKKSLSRIFKLMDLAKKAGADAIKIQSYTPDTLTMNIKNKHFKISNKKSLWNRKYLYDLYSEGETPWRWTNKIFKYAKKKKILCFSTPFDPTSVDMLEKNNCPIYKIGSFELNDFILLTKVAKTKKPVILSTGMATYQEIKSSIKILRKYGTKKIILLKCTSSYPASLNELNLETISDMKQKFGCKVGFSDHSIGILASIVAVCFGATIIEKHFTINKKDGAIDSKFSSDFEELKMLCDYCKKIDTIKGTINYAPTLSEIDSLKRRRSLFFTKNLKKGAILKKNEFGSFRPALGLETMYYKKVLGKKLIKDVTLGKPVKLNDFK